MMRDAFRAVNENVRPLLLFIAIDLPVTLAALGVNEYYLKPNQDTLGERTAGMIATVEGIVQVAVYAVAASVVFARFARNLDRPMWKIAGDREALSRFLPMWLLMGFVYLGFARFGIILFEAGYEEVGAGIHYTGRFLGMCIVPFGAMVTFLGNGGGEDLRMAARMIPNIIDRFLLALIIGFFQVQLFSTLLVAEELPFWVKPVVSVFDVYVDCVVFSYIFLACQEQRDQDEHPDDPYDM